MWEKNFGQGAALRASTALSMNCTEHDPIRVVYRRGNGWCPLQWLIACSQACPSSRSTCGLSQTLVPQSQWSTGLGENPHTSQKTATSEGAGGLEKAWTKSGDRSTRLTTTPQDLRAASAPSAQSSHAPRETLPATSRGDRGSASLPCETPAPEGSCHRSPS